jgi:hypothetical protein
LHCGPKTFCQGEARILRKGHATPPPEILGQQRKHKLNQNSQALASNRARILKHLVEAEESTFRGELSFKRSAYPAGLTVATIFCVHCKDYFVEVVKKNL